MELKVELPEASSTGFLEDLGSTLSKLLGQLSGGLEAIAQPKQVQAATKALKGCLMSFDKLNRLTAKSGKSGKNTDALKDFIAALQDEKNLENLDGPFRNMAQLFRNFGIDLKTDQELLAELRRRLEELPGTMTRLSLNAAALSGAFLGMPPAAQQVREGLGQMDRGMLDTVDIMERLPISARSAVTGLEHNFLGIGDFFKIHVQKPLDDTFKNLFAGLPPAANRAVTDLEQSFSEGAGNIKDTFETAWGDVLSIFGKTDDGVGSLASGVTATVKNTVNQLITGINNAIVEPFSGVSTALNKLKNFTFNGVQPFKNLNFSVSMPKIPLLASGAVLPANKPFLAMVGDQKHGTNIEAPLTTIQQAVALVMEDVTAAQLAGQNATVEVLRQILEAVLGIEVTEDTLGRAAARYNARQAMITGGF